MKQILVITKCEEIHQNESDNVRYFYVPIKYLNSSEKAEIFSCGRNFHALQIVVPINKNQFEILMSEIAHRMIK